MARKRPSSARAGDGVDADSKRRRLSQANIRSFFSPMVATSDDVEERGAGDDDDDEVPSLMDVEERDAAPKLKAALKILHGPNVGIFSRPPEEGVFNFGRMAAAAAVGAQRPLLEQRKDAQAAWHELDGNLGGAHHGKLADIVKAKIASGGKVYVPGAGTGILGRLLEKEGFDVLMSDIVARADCSVYGIDDAGNCVLEDGETLEGRSFDAAVFSLMAFAPNVFAASLEAGCEHVVDGGLVLVCETRRHEVYAAPALLAAMLGGMLVPLGLRIEKIGTSSMSFMVFRLNASGTLETNTVALINAVSSVGSKDATGRLDNLAQEVALRLGAASAMRRDDIGASRAALGLSPARPGIASYSQQLLLQTAGYVVLRLDEAQALAQGPGSDSAIPFAQHQAARTFMGLTTCSLVVAHAALGLDPRVADFLDNLHAQSLALQREAGEVQRAAALTCTCMAGCVCACGQHRAGLEKRLDVLERKLHGDHSRIPHWGDQPTGQLVYYIDMGDGEGKIGRTTRGIRVRCEREQRAAGSSVFPMCNCGALDQTHAYAQARVNELVAETTMIAIFGVDNTPYNTTFGDASGDGNPKAAGAGSTAEAEAAIVALGETAAAAVRQQLKSLAPLKKDSPELAHGLAALFDLHSSLRDHEPGLRTKIGNAKGGAGSTAEAEAAIVALGETAAAAVRQQLKSLAPLKKDSPELAHGLAALFELHSSLRDHEPGLRTKISKTRGGLARHKE